MVKKSLVLLLASMCALTSVSAQELSVDINGIGSTVTVSGTAKSDDTVSVFVSKKARAGTYGDIVYANEVKSDENGNWSIEFHMPDYEDETLDIGGKYTAYAADGSEERRTDTLNYVSKKTRLALIDELNEKTDADEILELLLKSGNSDTLAAMGISGLKSYPSVWDTVSNAILDILPCKSETVLADVYREAFAVAVMNKAENLSEFKHNIETAVGDMLSFTVDGENIKNDEDEYEFVVKYLFYGKPYDEFKDADEKIREGYILYKLNGSNKASMTDVVKKYADELKISSKKNYDLYKTDTTVQTVVNENTIAALKSGGADKLDEFVTEFTKQLTSYKKSTPGGSNSSGGGGGSSSSGGSSVSGGIVSSAVIKPTVKEDTTVTFTDLDNVSWAKDAVEYLAGKGIVNGNGGGEFAPEDDVTREQFVKMIAELMNISEYADISFDDVARDAWYYDYVSRAVAAGIVNGVSDKMFGTGESLTREDASVIIARCMKILGVNADDVKEYDPFADENEISDYALESVISLYKKGIVNGMGDGRFAPKEKLSRAQAAKLIYELCKTGGIQ